MKERQNNRDERRKTIDQVIGKERYYELSKEARAETIQNLEAMQLPEQVEEDVQCLFLHILTVIKEWSEHRMSSESAHLASYVTPLVLKLLSSEIGRLYQKIQAESRRCCGVTEDPKITAIFEKVQKDLNLN